MKISLLLLASISLCAGCASRPAVPLEASGAGAPGRANMQPPSLPVAVEGTPGAPTFDLDAAYGALSNVDLTECKAAGLASGYVHATVAFTPDGTVWGVSLAVPESSAAGARTCVDATLRDVHVAPFAGAALATVHRTIFVS
jgi:hypothetical protein